MAARGKVYPPAGSSRVEAHESCRVKSLDAACLIFVSRTPVIDRDGWTFALGTECGKVSAFSEGLPGIPRISLKISRHLRAGQRMTG